MHILITGATRGIGFAAAQQLAARGAKVIIASRDGARAAAAAQAIGQGTRALALDITDPGSIAQAVAQLTHDVGCVDVLVNNSAILLDHYEGLLSLKAEVLRETLETNLIGTLRFTQALVPLLSKAAAPRVINVSSGAGQLDGEPQAWAPAYSMSKTALNMLTQQLTAALPEFAINSMCPGWCRTEMGGEEAPRTAAEGAETITWLALDAPHTLRGGFFRDKERIAW